MDRQPQFLPSVLLWAMLVAFLISLGSIPLFHALLAPWRQRTVADAVRQAGGSVQMDSSANAAGGHGDVIKIQLQDKVIPDFAWYRIQFANKVELLNLSRSNVTVSHLHWLDGADNLKVLYLNHTSVGIDVLDHLSPHCQLSQLWMSGADVSAMEESHLEKLNRLEFLDFSNSNADDRTATMLRKCPSLKSLDLGGTAVTDSGLIALGSCPNLTQLMLVGCDISDRAVAEFMLQKPDATLWTNHGLAAKPNR